MRVIGGCGSYHDVCEPIMLVQSRGNDLSDLSLRPNQTAAIGVYPDMIPHQEDINRKTLMHSAGSKK